MSGIICPVRETNMKNHKQPSEKREFKPAPPKWSTYWYLPIMLLLLWAWQSAVMQFAYHTIPYSEFKDRVRKGEIAECTITESTIEGTIKSKAETQPAITSTNVVAEMATSNPPGSAKAAAKKDFFFRTVRVEDPNLVKDL